MKYVEDIFPAEEMEDEQDEDYTKSLITDGTLGSVNDKPGSLSHSPALKNYDTIRNVVKAGISWA